MALQLSPFDDNGQELTFKDGIFYHVYANYQPTKRIQDFFAAHYENINKG